MPSTHLALNYHLIFSTKHREPCLSPPWRDNLHAYMGGVISGMNVEFLQKCGVEYDDKYLW